MINELDNFRKYAIQGGITAPLCDEYRELWRACGKNKEKLMQLALRQQSIPYFVTHCYEGKGLSMEFITNEFKDYINENTKKAIFHDCDCVKGYEYSLYVDFKALNKLNTDISCFMWSNVPLYEIKAVRAQILYIACNSHVKLSLNGYNNIMVYLFDESTITIEDMDDTSKIIIYKFSNNCNVEYGKFFITNENNVKQFNKQLIL